MRHFVLPMLCFLTSGQYTCALVVSPQNLDLGVSRTDLYIRPSSSATVGVSSQNLTLPPNPFIFESVAGYKAVYTYERGSSFPSTPASQLIASTMKALEQERQAEGKVITDPIPGGKVLAKETAPYLDLTWEIDQEGVRSTEILSYEHAVIALQGTEYVIRAYDDFVKQYAFALYKTRNMEFVAKGYLRGHRMP